MRFILVVLMFSAALLNAGQSRAQEGQDGNVCERVSIKLNLPSAFRICLADTFEDSVGTYDSETMAYSEDGLITSIFYDKAQNGAIETFTLEKAAGELMPGDEQVTYGETGKFDRYDLLYYWSENGGELGGSCNGVIYLTQIQGQRLYGIICKDADAPGKLSDDVLQYFFSALQAPF